jgi:hypothetical protein
MITTNTYDDEFYNSKTDLAIKGPSITMPLFSKNFKVLAIIQVNLSSLGCILEFEAYAKINFDNGKNLVISINLALSFKK